MNRPNLLSLLCILLYGCTNQIPAHLPTARPTPSPVSNLATGSTWKRPSDGMIMVSVPAGEFSMGSPDDFGFSSEHPAHPVNLDAFWIDKTDVTNSMYAGCVQAGVCAAPRMTKSQTRADYYGNSQFADFPVIFVDWNQTAAYCQWAGVRLPTEAQWEKAARGTDGRTYPWGNAAPTCALANFGGSSSCTGDTSAVNDHPAGASPYGALDMAGNVWQWVSDWYDPSYYSYSPKDNPTGPAQHGPDSTEHPVRGGSWLAQPEWTHSANRAPFEMGNWENVVGFRCARPAP
jgi:formylglycine-generating enzyme required for sulfatase activity